MKLLWSQEFCMCFSTNTRDSNIVRLLLALHADPIMSTVREKNLLKGQVWYAHRAITSLTLATLDLLFSAFDFAPVTMYLHNIHMSSKCLRGTASGTCAQPYRLRTSLAIMRYIIYIYVTIVRILCHIHYKDNCSSCKWSWCSMLTVNFCQCWSASCAMQSAAPWVAWACQVHCLAHWSWGRVCSLNGSGCTYGRCSKAQDLHLG